MMEGYGYLQFDDGNEYIGIFVEDEMQGLDWGKLYETYHRQSYDRNKVSALVKELLSDYYVKDRKGVFEYILGGCVDKSLLNIRIFDEITNTSFVAPNFCLTMSEY